MSAPQASYARGDTGLTPLLAACFSGHVEVATFLIDSGADIDAATKETGRTPLYAAAQEGHVDVVRLLIKRGALMDKASESSGVTPLWIATQNDHLPVVELLCASGADTCKGKLFHDEQMEPTMVAAYNGRLAVLQCLASYGANISTATLMGRTASTVARHAEHFDVVEWLAEAVDYNMLEIAASAGRKASIIHILNRELADPDASSAGKLIKLAAPHHSKDPSLRVLLRTICDGWSPESHWLYPRRMRQAVHTVLLVQERLWRQRQVAVAAAELVADGGAAAQKMGASGCAVPVAVADRPSESADGGSVVAVVADGNDQLPELPSELWFFCILRLTLSRVWWGKAARDGDEQGDDEGRRNGGGGEEQPRAQDQ